MGLHQSSDRMQVCLNYKDSFVSISLSSAYNIQGGVFGQLEGFDDTVLLSSPGRLTDTVAMYGQGRPLQLKSENITKP